MKLLEWFFLGSSVGSSVARLLFGIAIGLLLVSLLTGCASIGIGAGVDLTKNEQTYPWYETGAKMPKGECAKLGIDDNMLCEEK